jgi:hypothetical protein
MLINASSLENNEISAEGAICISRVINSLAHLQKLM